MGLLLHEDPDDSILDSMILSPGLKKIAKTILSHLYPTTKKKLLRDFIEPTWCLDQVLFADSKIVIDGWMVQPPSFEKDLTFSCSGREFLEVRTGIVREDIERLFWWIPQAKFSGFHCETHFKNGSFDKTDFVLSLVDKETLLPIDTNQNYHVEEDILSQNASIPDSGRRTKVHGGADLTSFLIEGYSTYRKLELALGKFCDTSLDAFDAILDWGCGCGRLTRYFGERSSQRIVGIDIDADNIEWCKSNLPFAHFDVISPVPRLNFKGVSSIL